jgi:hypothetical protein
MTNNDTMETIVYPKPPSQTAVNSLEELNGVLEELSRYNRGVARYNDDLYNILHSGYLVRSFRVENLTADTITSGIIGVDQIYLGDEKFEFDGILKQIRVKDAQPSPVTRVEIGAFGSGADYGIKVRDAAGTLVFQAASTTFIDGAVINNATITGAKLVNATVGTTKLEDLAITTGKIASGAVTNAKITDLSASKITVSGTLTVSSATTAIAVTGAGAVVFASGGDIIMRASGSNFNYITFQNGSSQNRGYLNYNATSNFMFLTSTGGAGIAIDAASDAQIIAAASVILSAPDVQLGLSSNQDILMTGRVDTAVLPKTDNLRALGSASLRWSDVRAVLINGADFCFENQWRLTEANHVWTDAPPNAVALMNQEWKPMAVFDERGNIFLAGVIHPNFMFEPPTIKRREPVAAEPTGTEYLN